MYVLREPTNRSNPILGLMCFMIVLMIDIYDKSCYVPNCFMIRRLCSVFYERSCVYKVVENHRMPYLYRSFFTKEPCN